MATADLFTWTPQPPAKLIHLGKRAVGLRLKGLFVVAIMSYTQYSEADVAPDVNQRIIAWKLIFLALAQTAPIAGDIKGAT